MLNKKLNDLNKQIEKVTRHLEVKPNDKNSARVLIHTLIPKKLALEEAIASGKESQIKQIFPKKQKLSEKTVENIVEPVKPQAPKFNRNIDRIKPPVPINIGNVPEKQVNPFALTGDDRTSYSTPPLIEIEMPESAELYDAVVKFFKSKNDNFEDIVREWALIKYNTLDNAQIKLVESAKVQVDSAFVRKQILVSPLKDKDKYLSLSDEDLIKNTRAIKIAIETVQEIWVSDLLSDIFDRYKNTGKIDVGHAKKKFKEMLSGFHSSVNSDKTKNPNFPFLSQNLTSSSMSEIVEEAIAVTSLEGLHDTQKKLGKISRKPIVKNELVGTITARQIACVIYDKQTNQFCLAIPNATGSPLDFDRYTFFDGSHLLSANDLITSKNKSKSCIVLPLKMKHDFRRWYNKHVDNHDPNAPLERRCLQKTIQFKMKPEANGFRILLRLGLRFYNPFYQVDRLTKVNGAWKSPNVKYLIGIDRGIHSPFQAVVYDVENSCVIERFEAKGRREEWNYMKWQIAVQAAHIAKLKRINADKRRISKATTNLRRLYKKSKCLSSVQVVESIAKMSDYIENKYGTGNYAYVLELLSDNMNLKGSNRVKWIAEIRKALTNQMIKKGYRHKRGATIKETWVDGVIDVLAMGTSQVSPSGFVSNSKTNNDGILGRNIGYCYLRKSENGIYLKKTKNRKGDSFGCQLYYDGNTGKIYDADFIGAINIAVRPLLYDGYAKISGDTWYELSSDFNPSIKFDCVEPLYEFVEVDGDPHGAIRLVSQV